MAMGAAVRAAAADGVVTFLWVLCVSTLSASMLGASTAAVTTYLSLHEGIHYALLVTVSILTLLLFAFNLLCDALGGASFNPTGVAAFYAAGLTNPSLFSIALRLPAQAASAVGGALAILELMPEQYKHMLGGTSLKVDPHTGVVAEGVLTFVITFVVLCIIVKGPRNPIVKTAMLSVSTVSLVLTGAAYTGPSMNPANEMAKKCYVVYIGRVLGVYEEWKDCQKQVNNFSGNNYQRYESREVAEEKWRRHGRNKWRNFLVITTLLLFMVGYVFYFI